MILKSAIKAYLEEDKDDHSWMKELSHKEIDSLINELRPKPNLTPGLFLNQKIGFYLGVAYPGFSFWMDMGSGKSLLTLELIKYWRKAGLVKKAVVFVITNKAFLTWENQIKRYKIGLPVIALEGASSEEKWEQFESQDEGIVLATYSGVVAMCATRSKGKNGKGKMALDPKLVKRFGKGVNFIALDESTKAGYDTSLTHKLCDKLCKTADYHYALAGIPFGRDPIMLWSQQRIIDGGESLGSVKALFQEAFFSKQKNFFAKSRYAFDYKFKKSMSPKLARMMRHRSITYEEHELKDLPKLVQILDLIKFPPDMQEYHRSAVKELAKSKGNFSEVKNIFLRMRQISSGFLGFKDDETGERAQLAFSENPKLERLLELLDNLPAGCKAVVFYDYTWSAQQITEKLTKKLKMKHIWLWSGTKNARDDLNRFTEDPEVKVALINNRVGAYSLDGLQRVANYCFFYESPVSVIDRSQAERRIRREGQLKKVYQYDLVCQGSVDERILAFHRDGRDLMKVVRKNPAILN